MVQCKAKSKQSGQQCKRHAVPGRAVCYMHGGASLSGPRAPGFKHGFYSTLLPAGLGKIFRKVYADREALLAALEEVALLRTRIAELIGRLKTGETSGLWRDLRTTYAELAAATKAGDEVHFRQALERLGAVIEAAGDVETVWAELFDAIERKTRVAERETRRQVMMQEVITADRALALITSIMQSVVRNVSDLDARTQIGRDMRSFMGDDPRGEPVALPAELEATLATTESAHPADL